MKATPPSRSRKRVQVQEDPLAHLNRVQKEAVTYEGGPLLLLAGAGTGKTTVITERIAWLIKKRQVRPDSILALTFTEKAATEMEERLDRLLPLGYSRVVIETFHGFCERMLHEYGLEAGIDPSFRILSVPQQWLLLRYHLYRLPLSYFRPLGNPTKFLRSLVGVLGAAKDQDIAPQKFAELSETYSRNAEQETDTLKKEARVGEAARWKEFAELYRAYNALLLQESAMDFGDLLLQMLRLLRERPAIRVALQERFPYILVDEFQDTNNAQNELLQLLVNDKQNITVVGDDDQSIYAWRGSNMTNILHFQETFPAVHTLVLTENYRSSQAVLDVAYTLIQNNNPYRLEYTTGVEKKLIQARTDSLEDALPLHAHFSTTEQEGAYISETINHLIKSEKYTYKDCAILLRTNAQADDIVPSLLRRDIPFRVSDARGLLLRPEIRDVSAYLRLLVDAHEAVAAFRLISLPIFGLAPLEVQRILHIVKQKNMSVIECMQEEVSRPAVFPKEKQELLSVLLTLFQEDLTRASTALPSTIFLHFLEGSGYLKHLLQIEAVAAEALPNLTEFLNFIKEYERAEPTPSLLGFVEYLDLVLAAGESPSQASLGGDIDAVRLLTVHGAKGLEFPVVFILGATSDKYPIRHRHDALELPDAFAPTQELDPRDAHVQEERRLFYVALTRARDRLFVTSADRSGSQKMRKKPSSFIAEAGIHTEENPRPSIAEQLQLPLSFIQVPESPFELLTLPGTVSVSQVETYTTCPLKYAYQYVYKIPLPLSHALVFGITIHAVLRDVARLVLAKGQATLEDVETLFQKHWSGEGFGSKAQEALQKKRGEEMLRTYVHTHPDILTKRALFIEEPFRFHIGNMTIVGRIDRVDGGAGNHVSVTDYKTGSVKTQKDADTDMQLSVYALALKEVFGKEIGSLSLSFLDGAVDRVTTRTETDLANVKERLQAVGKRIEERDFAPTPSMPICRMCEFRTICDASVA